MPKSMDDWWFIYYQDDWLYFHRSWTGFCIYEVKLKITEVGADIDEAWVSGDLKYYRSMGRDEDINILLDLIEYKLPKNNK